MTRAELIAVEYAGFWRRVAAVIVDGLIMTAVSVVSAGVLGIALGFATASLPETEIFAVAYYLISLPGGWLYCTIMESSARQATLGKAVIGVVVTDLEGNRISFGRANGRYFLKVASGLTLGLGLLMAGLTAKKQALHDLLAGTLVVRKHAPE